MILLLDNYDSFAHNLARYFRQLDQEVVVVRNDRITVGEAIGLKPSALVISPGPGTPVQSGIGLELIAQCSQSIPVLGVCLGHQIICQSFGGTISTVAPVHGRSSKIHHSGHNLFDRVESPFVAGRYHSLIVEPATVPESFEVIARTDDGIVMAVAHRQIPVFGVQFHPESILTRCGYRILANFLSMANLPVDQSFVDSLTIDFDRQTVGEADRRRMPKPQVTDLLC